MNSKSGKNHFQFFSNRIFSAIFPFYSTRLNPPMMWIELEFGQKVKMMTLQSNSDHSIGTLVTSVTRVYQIEVDPNDIK